MFQRLIKQSRLKSNLLRKSMAYIYKTITDEQLDSFVKNFQKRPNKPIKRLEKDLYKWSLYDENYTKCIEKEPKITQDMQTVSANTDMALWNLKFCKKSPDSYDRKVRDQRLDLNEFKPITDILRYTFIHSDNEAVENIKKNFRELIKYNYCIKKIDNKWLSGPDEYRSIHCDVQLEDIVFEIQYSTEYNLRIKQQTHAYYEVFRDKTVARDMRTAAKIKQKEMAQQYKRPQGIEDINDEILFG